MDTYLSFPFTLYSSFKLIFIPFCRRTRGIIVLKNERVNIEEYINNIIIFVNVVIDCTDSVLRTVAGGFGSFTLRSGVADGLRNTSFPCLCLNRFIICNTGADLTALMLYFSDLIVPPAPRHIVPLTPRLIVPLAPRHIVPLAPRLVVPLTPQLIVPTTPRFIVTLTPDFSTL